MQNKGTGVNSFNEGLNTDNHPLTSRNTQLIDALNAEIITVGENQFMLKNIPGNKKAFSLDPGFIPLAVKTFNNVAYIVSGSFDSAGTFLQGQLGTYPSPVWSKYPAEDIEVAPASLPEPITLSSVEVIESSTWEFIESTQTLATLSTISIPDSFNGRTIKLTIKLKSRSSLMNGKSYELRTGVSTSILTGCKFAPDLVDPEIFPKEIVTNTIYSVDTSEPMYFGVTTSYEGLETFGEAIFSACSVKYIVDTETSQGGDVSIQETFKYDGQLLTEADALAIATQAIQSLNPGETVTSEQTAELFQKISSPKTILDDYPLYTVDKYYPAFVSALKSKLPSQYNTLALVDDILEITAEALSVYVPPVLDDDYASDSVRTDLVDLYSPLHNFLSDEGELPAIPDSDLEDDTSYVMPFTTSQFNFDIRDFVDLALQKEYDESINFIFTDDRNPVKLINSRFKVNEDGTATIIDRRATKDSNTYSTVNFDSTNLILRPKTVANLNFLGVSENGKLKGGSYRYFFRYKNADGNVSDLIAESRAVVIYNGNSAIPIGVAGDEFTSKSSAFILSNIDPTFNAVEVSYSHSYGENDIVTDTYTIDRVFYASSEGSVNITHSGYETVTQIDPSTINTEFSSVGRVKTLAQINNRLVFANIASSIDEELFVDLEEASKSIYITEKLVNINDSYADPLTVYNDLGYWRGESYELGIVYILKDGSLSPAYPILGVDNYDGSISGINDYPTAAAYPENQQPEKFKNTLGVYRTAKETIIADQSNEYAVKLVVNTDDLLDEFIGRVNGFFIVRKDRLKDVLYQGYVVPTLAVPATNVVSANPIIEASRGTVWQASDKRFVGYHTDMKVGYYTASSGGEEIKAENVADYSYNFVRIPALTSQIVMTTAAGTLSIESGKVQDSSLTAFYCGDMEISSREVAGIDGIISMITINSNINEVATVGLASTEYFVINDIKSDITPQEFSSKFQVIPDGSPSYGNNSFSAQTDRTYNILDVARVIEAELERIAYRKLGDTTNHRLFDGWGYNSGSGWDLGSSSVFVPGLQYKPYTSLNVNFSKYVGMELFSAGTTTPSDFINGYPSTLTLNFFPPSSKGDATYLAEIHASNSLISVANLQNIYAAPTSANYFTVSDRVDITNGPVASVEIGDGDCFVGELTKRITYPIGIPEAAIANVSDRTTYGVGHSEPFSINAKPDDVEPYETDDRGRNLDPQAQYFRMKAQNNHNVCIRSEEFFSAEEMGIYGTKRSFKPLKSGEILTSEYRPDSSNYNFGYTCNGRVVGYTGVDSSAPIYSLAYPNRVMISSPNISSEFLNGYRSISGLNFKDYNSELGQIVKVINHNNILFCVFEQGVAVITVDGRTLINSESDIYIDDAQALASKATVLSTKVGSQHPESIISSIYTVYGVDYMRNKVWKVNGSNIEIISDFNIEEILLSIKNNIKNSGTQGLTPSKYTPTCNLPETLPDNMRGLPRVYTSFDESKKNIHVSFNKLMYEYEDGAFINFGNVQYNEVLGKWVTRTSFATKFQFSYNENNIAFDAIDYMSEAWVDTIDQLYCNFRGKQCPFEIEFVMHERPDIEKILTNLQILSNKVKPEEITYITTGDVPNAALRQNNTNYYDAEGNLLNTIDYLDPNNLTETVHVDKIKIREDSPSMSIGIFQENAYYKDGKYFVQVGKTNSFSRFNSTQKRIRDKYFKIRIKYSGENYVYLYSIISLFTNNYD